VFNIVCHLILVLPLLKREAKEGGRPDLGQPGLGAGGPGPSST
jgi:hypothetical protein